MELININGTPVYLAEAQLVETQGQAPTVVKLGRMVADLGKCASRGESTAIAQFYKIVMPGLILAKHIFKGLERPLYLEGDMEGDANKLVYSWKPKWDYEWEGDRFHGGPARKAPINTRVFVAIISPNNDKGEFPEIAGWIEHWNWVKENSSLDAAPVEWETRYTEKLWSQS